MQYSKSGLVLTERFEQCRLVAYWDPLGKVWTIGWGHTYDVHKGDTCSQEQADAWAENDTAIATSCVNVTCAQRIAAGEFTQGMFDALVDFVFNLGCSRFRKSTMRRLLNAGDYKGAAAEFPKWDWAGGHVVAGLLKRRLAEQGEFNG